MSETNDIRDGVRLVGDPAPVSLIEIARPRARNALDVAAVAALGAAVGAADDDPDVRCIVITGAEGHFSAGSDIKEMHRLGFSCLRDPRRVAGWTRLEHVATPMIAAVDGMALGAGFELALLADFIVCSATARFGLPETKLGVLPGDGGTQRLPRLIGVNAALRLILTGEIVAADVAVRLGIAEPAAQGEGARDAALRFAGMIAANAPLATRAVKATVRRGAALPLADGLALEADALSKLFASDDQSEGMAAFVEKRPAVFRGS